MTLDEFYARDDGFRRRSPEADYGVNWTDGGKRWPYYRVSYIKATGEVYAVCQNPPHAVEVLGIVPPDAIGTYYRTLDAQLDGWAEVHDLAWVRERMAVAS